MIKAIAIILAAAAIFAAKTAAPKKTDTNEPIAVETSKVEYPEQPIDGTDVSLRDLWEATHE